MKCKHWKKIPSYFGNIPRCGFTKSGQFTTDNWNCKLLNDLRDLAGEEMCGGHFCDDQKLYVKALPDFFADRKFDFVVISVYKFRGRTSGVWIISDDRIRWPTEDEVKKIIRLLKKAKK